MSKKYASNDKDRLLVENFRKFMEEGDFSADLEEMSITKPAVLDSQAAATEFGKDVASAVLHYLLRNEDDDGFVKTMESIMHDDKYGERGADSGHAEALDAFKEARGKRGKLVPVRKYLRRIYDGVTRDYDQIAASGKSSAGIDQMYLGVDRMELVLKKLDNIIGGTPTGERGLSGDRFVGLEK